MTGPNNFMAFIFSIRVLELSIFDPLLAAS